MLGLSTQWFCRRQVPTSKTGTEPRPDSDINFSWSCLNLNPLIYTSTIQLYVSGVGTNSTIGILLPRSTIAPMATNALRSQVAAKWQESFHRLNGEAPGISGLMKFSEVYWTYLHFYMVILLIKNPGMGDFTSVFVPRRYQERDSRCQWCALRYVPMYIFTAVWGSRTIWRSQGRTLIEHDLLSRSLTNPDDYPRYWRISWVIYVGSSPSPISLILHPSEDMRKNFYLIENEINEYIGRYEVCHFNDQYSRLFETRWRTTDHPKVW